MLASIGILCGFFSIGIIARYYFFRKNLEIEKTHKILVHSLKMDIEKHQGQVALREQNLNKYHFLRYNLSESLVSQPSIRI